MPRHDDSTYPNNTKHIANIKSFIVSSYSPTITNVVIIIGHVPIPYSGVSASDGHYSFTDTNGFHAGHEGAWPADAYYGNTNNAAWTDTNATSVPNIGYPRDTNILGDGKFDNESLPPNAAGFPLQLAVGRIDFSEMPAFFPKTEADLLRQYLNKNVRYRTGQLVPTDRATLIGFFSYAPATNSYTHENDMMFQNGRANATRWFGIGPGKLVHADIYNQTNQVSGDYLWAFHAGNGDIRAHYGDGGFHFTSDLADTNKEPRTAFYFLHGSWFGDWNLTSDNFLRATLATPNYGLASVGLSTLALLPPFKMETLGLGEPLANAMLQTSAALGSNVPRWMTILGDPTLRLKMPTPVSGFAAVRNGSNWNLSWNSLSGAANYYIYRSTTGIDGSWLPHLAVVTGSTTYVDSGAPSNALYIVRAAILTTTGCGSYTNLTQGVFAP